MGATREPAMALGHPIHREESFVTEALDKDWQPGMMMWFGEDWGAPVNESCKQASVPVGRECLFDCEFLIAEVDQGFLIQGPDGYEPIHRHCMIEMTLGPNWRQFVPEDAL